MLRVFIRLFAVKAVAIACIVAAMLYVQNVRAAQVSPQGCRVLAEVAFKIAEEKSKGDTMEAELDELAAAKGTMSGELYIVLRRLVVLVHRMKGEPQDIGVAVLTACFAAQGDTDKFIPAAYRL